MSGGVEFAFSLIDKASGPAEKIAEGLGGASEALGKLDEASGKTSKLTKAVNILTIGLRTLQIAAAGIELFKAFGGSTDMLKKWFAGVKAGLASFATSAAAAAKKAAPFVAAGGGAALIGKGLMMATPPAVGLGLGLLGIAAAATAAAVAVALLGAKAAFALGHAVVQAGLFREKMVAAFNIQGKGSGGLAAFEQAKDIAKEFGAPLEKTEEFFLRMKTMQFPIAQTKELFLRMQDLKIAAGKSQEELDRALNAIIKIRTTGHLQGDELDMLAEAGLNTDLVFQNLAKALKKTVPEIKKMKEAGKLGATETIQAIQEAMGQMAGGGPAGQVAKDFKTKTMPGLIGAIKEMGPILLDDIAKAAGPGLEQLKPIAQEVLAALTSDDAKAVTKELGAAFVLLATGAREAWPFLKEIFAGFKEGFGEGWDALKDVGESIAEAFGGDKKKLLDEMTPGLKMFGQLLGRAAAAVVILAAAYGAALAAAVALGGVLLTIPSSVQTATDRAWKNHLMVMDALRSSIDQFVEFHVELAAAGLQMGADLVNGLVNGILAGIARVTSAASSVGKAAIAGLDSVLSFGSPSKTMFGLGQLTAAGFAGGANDNAFAAHEAMANVAATPSVTASASGMRGGSITVNIVVNVTGGENPHETGAAVAQSLRPELESIFEQLAREVAA